MPSLDISEYMDSSHGNPIEPPVAHQTLTLGPEPAQSRPFHKSTVVVRVVADVNCRVGFGIDPEATSLLHAGREMTRVIHPGSGFRLCAMLAGEDGQMSGDRFDALIALVTNPAACAKRKAELDKLEKATDAKLKKLAAEQTEFATKSAAHVESVAKFTQDKTDFEAFFAEHDADLKGRETALATAKASFESETAEASATLKRREDDVTKREDAVADRARMVREDEAKISDILADLERRRGLIKQAGF